MVIDSIVESRLDEFYTRRSRIYRYCNEIGQITVHISCLSLFIYSYLRISNPDYVEINERKFRYGKQF